MKTRILIIDYLNFVYRGVISFGKPIAPEEDNTITYNFFRNLRALIEQFKPDKCIMVLEGVPTFRYNLFPDYKKNRILKLGTTKADSKLKVLQQAAVIQDLLQFLPITLVKAHDYEADDTIHTLAHNLKNEEVIIVSSDSDLIQILQSLHGYDIKLYHASKKQFIEAPEYVYLVWKSLAGDKQSDNIPAIISKTKAEHLAVTPHALESFLAVEENRANFSLNKQLIELRLVPDDQLIITQHSCQFEQLFLKFEELKLPSLSMDVYKSKFINTFDALN